MKRLLFLGLSVLSLHLFADENLLRENYLRLDGDETAFDQIMCFSHTHGNSVFKGKMSIENKRYISIADFNKPATQARLFILDTKTNEVRAYFIAHGVGVKKGAVELFKLHELSPEKKNKLAYPNTHSNSPGSNATPRGVFILGETYKGSFGYSLRIHGLQKNINDNTANRAVVMHGFEGMNPTVVSSNDPDASSLLTKAGNIALSQGCTMLEPRRAKEVIDMLKGNSLYYNYTRHEKQKGSHYCADENLMDL